MMSDQCSYTNCSVIIPRMIYTGGDLAAAIILTALFVAGITAALHIGAFYMVYKKRFLPKMTKTSTESRKAVVEESCTINYEPVDESSTPSPVTTRAPLPPPKIGINLAYQKTKMPLDQEIEHNKHK